MDWLRWYHGTATDPKMGLVARRSGASRCEVVAVWAAVLEHASTGDDRGSLDRLNPELIAYALDIDDGRARSIIEQMTVIGMITDGRVAAWEKRQPAREDLTAAERKRRQRERERQERMQPVDADADAAEVENQDEQAGCRAVSRTVTHASRSVTAQSRAEQRKENISPEPSAVLRPPACARTHAREGGAAPGEAIADLPTDVAPSKPDAVPAQEEPRPDAAPAEVDPDAVPGRGTADADSAPDADSGNSRSDPQAYRLALIASGFAEGQTVKPAAIRILRQWSADAVPLALIADAAAVATGRLGSLPDSPAYLAPIVAELSRSAGDPHVRSDRRPARVAGGGRPCLADQAADAERRALDALQRRRRPERDITPGAADAS